MRKIQTLGIILSVVMLCGSIPMGFSEPLKEQLEKGIEIENIQCDNSNVLVQRPNGKLACVSELTAEKMEWEIISSIQKIVYDYPLNANSFESEQYGSEPTIWFGTIELSISKLPKIGETATLTYTYTQTREHQPYDPYLYHHITLSENLSFVNQTDVFFYTADPEIYYDRDFESLSKPVEHMNINDTMTWIVEFTAVDEGPASVYTNHADASTSYDMFVGEEETLLYDDYIILYGEPVRIQRSEPFLTNEKLHELYLEALEDGENSTVRACYDVPRNERLELYEALELTEAEIQKEFENCAAQHLAIQSLSDPIPKIVYDYPISSKGPLTNGGENISQTFNIGPDSSRITPSTGNSAPAKEMDGSTILDISKIPVLDESVEITLRTIQRVYENNSETFTSNIGFDMSGFEVLEADPVFNVYTSIDSNGVTKNKGTATLNQTKQSTEQVFEYKIIAKPTKLGAVSIKFNGLAYDVRDTLWIGTDKSYHYYEVKYDFLDVIQIVDDDWILRVNANVDFDSENRHPNELEDGYAGRTIAELNQANIPLIYNTTSFQVDIANLTPMQENFVFERYNILDASLDHIRMFITRETILPTETIDSLMAQFPPRIESQRSPDIPFNIADVTIMPSLPTEEELEADRARVEFEKTPEGIEQVKIDTYGDLTIDEIIYLSPWTVEDYVAMIEVRDFSEEQAREFLTEIQAPNIEEIITLAFPYSQIPGRDLIKSRYYL